MGVRKTVIPGAGRATVEVALKRTHLLRAPWGYLKELTGTAERKQRTAGLGATE